MKYGNRPILTADDFAMACAALGFAFGMIGLTAVAFVAIMLAAMYAPIAIAIAIIGYVIDVVAFWWEHT